MKSLYKLAIVGRPNDGKSSIFANFLGDDNVAVSPIPGETKRIAPREINLGEVSVEVVDTPGLQHPETVYFKFREYAEAGRNPAAAFVAEFSAPRYAHDVEIMKALLGADICMLIVNADNIFAHTQKCLLDSLSLLGSKTAIVALINRKNDEYVGQWREELGSRGIEAFDFDAFKSKFSDCAGLFDGICASASLRARSDLAGVLRALKENRESLWKSNISAAAGEILDSIKALMQMRARLEMREFSLTQAERERLAKDFSKGVSSFVASARKKILRSFGYSGLRVNAQDFAPREGEIEFFVPNVFARILSRLPFMKKPVASCGIDPKSGFAQRFANYAAGFCRELVSVSYAQSATREFEMKFSGGGSAGAGLGSEKLARFAARAAKGDESDSFYEMQGELKDELARCIA